MCEIDGQISVSTSAERRELQSRRGATSNPIRKMADDGEDNHFEGRGRERSRSRDRVSNHDDEEDRRNTAVESQDEDNDYGDSRRDRGSNQNDREQVEVFNLYVTNLSFKVIPSTTYNPA
jgi:hypothetical protein